MSKKIKILLIISFFSYFLFFGQVSAADTVNPIYSMAVSGSVELGKSDSYARIILTDTSGNEYLIYEAQGPFDSGSFSFENTCEETCVLNGIVPKKVDVEVSGATIHIDKLFMIEDKASMNTQVQTMGMQTYAEALDPVQEDIKIDKMNQYIEKSGMEWTAGKTSMSGYSYEEKKNLFGLIVSPDDKMPNTQGFEYYTGGVFEMTRTGVSPKSAPTSNLPSSFDWRDRHGKNWLTSVKNQGDCGACWAFSINGTIEALTNLYFNKKININLSEQDLISCHNIGDCDGLDINNMEQAFNETRDKGVVTEECFRYAAYNIQCDKCSDWQQKRIISNGTFSEIYYDSPDYAELLKKSLINHGPLFAGIPAIGHAMVLIGYDTDPENNKPIWIFKNSHGSGWINQAFVKIRDLETFHSEILKLPPHIIVPEKFIKINYSPDMDINCEDKDNDTYCNWGISEEKPSTCPISCKSKKDCDDSNKKLGPFDSSFNCTIIGETPPSNQSPEVGKIILPSNISPDSPTHLSVQVSDDNKIDRCSFFIDGANSGSMELSQENCQSCTASMDFQFNEGLYSVLAKCWDNNGNVGIGEPIRAEITTSSFNVGTITPTQAIVDVETTFWTDVSCDSGDIASCVLFVDGQVTAGMSLSETPCFNCKASFSGAFISTGTYSVHVECTDKEFTKKGIGSPVTLTVTAGNYPDCCSNGVDLCENPPKCEEDCGAAAECDEKESNSSWSSGNNCHSCGDNCNYNTDSTKPSNHKLNGNTCFYDCDINCEPGGWTANYTSSNCKTENCHETKTSGSICYYTRSCGTSGCKYLNSDSNKECASSKCTNSGWDNSDCVSGEFWIPCDPTSGWKCGDNFGGAYRCEGWPIGWGSGDDGYVYCGFGRVIASEGVCHGKGDDVPDKQESRIKVVPQPQTFSDSVTFRAYSAWYCKFSCMGLFCGADGCGWAKCVPGDKGIDRIEFKVYNWLGIVQYSKTISGTDIFTWDGKKNNGKLLGNGTYGFEAKTFLTNGKSYTTDDTIKIQR